MCDPINLFEKFCLIHAVILPMWALSWLSCSVNTVSTRFFFLYFKSTTVPFSEIKSTTVDLNLQCKHLRRFRIEAPVAYLLGPAVHAGHRSLTPRLPLQLATCMRRSRSYVTLSLTRKSKASAALQTAK